MGLVWASALSVSPAGYLKFAPPTLCGPHQCLLCLKTTSFGMADFGLVCNLRFLMQDFIVTIFIPTEARKFQGVPPAVW